jgi:hypothetical protein
LFNNCNKLNDCPFSHDPISEESKLQLQNQAYFEYQKNDIHDEKDDNVIIKNFENLIKNKIENKLLNNIDNIVDNVNNIENINEKSKPIEFNFGSIFQG